jgi:hypothetical protein
LSKVNISQIEEHDPAKVVADLVITLGLGGDCLADVAVLRAEPDLFGRVASDPTVYRTVDALASDVDRALAAVDTVRAAARAHVWGLAGRHAADHRVGAEDPVVVDVDATLVAAHSTRSSPRRRSSAGLGFIRCGRSSTTDRPAPASRWR